MGPGTGLHLGQAAGVAWQAQDGLVEHGHVQQGGQHGRVRVAGIRPQRAVGDGAVPRALHAASQPHRQNERLVQQRHLKSFRPQNLRTCRMVCLVASRLA